jgi:DNA-binding MarR family transcriptional regulator
MHETATLEEARAIAALLPSVTRQLFAVDGNDPVAELPLAQLRVCGALYGGPRPMSMLSRELGVSLSALTQIADRLERAHLVTRVLEESDRRIRCLQLTEHGEKIMRARERARVERVSSMLGQLSPRARKEVLATLQAMMTACEAIVRREAVAKAST